MNSFFFLSLPLLPSDTFFVPDPLSPNGIAAFPYTDSSILLQWFQPQVSYVSSPLLLQYTLYYTRNSDTDVEDRPVRTNLTTSPSGMGTYILTGLDVGTEYYLTMSVSNRAGTSDVLGSVLVVRTFGSGQCNIDINVCTCIHCTLLIIIKIIVIIQLQYTCIYMYKYI